MVQRIRFVHEAPAYAHCSLQMHCRGFEYWGARASEHESSSSLCVKKKGGGGVDSFCYALDIPVQQPCYLCRLRSVHSTFCCCSPHIPTICAGAVETGPALLRKVRRALLACDSRAVSSQWSSVSTIAVLCNPDCIGSRLKSELRQQE